MDFAYRGDGTLFLDQGQVPALELFRTRIPA
jgi:hypothetical protein